MLFHITVVHGSHFAKLIKMLINLCSQLIYRRLCIIRASCFSRTVRALKPATLLYAFA